MDSFIQNYVLVYLTSYIFHLIDNEHPSLNIKLKKNVLTSFELSKLKINCLIDHTKY